MTFQNLIFVLIFVVFQVIAVVFAFRAMRHARTPQGAVGWVVFLLTAPYVAVPAFLFLGHKRFSGYISMRREMRQTISRVTSEISSNAPADLSRLGERRRIVAAFEALSEHKVLSGNATKLLVDGDATFSEILSVIDAAKDYVLVQFYTIRDDELGRKLASHLSERARAGVRVKVLYDGIGSVGLPSLYIEDLRAAGVEILNFHAQTGSRNRFQLNFRNHRKIVVVDGLTGFTGGHNVGDEYMGRSRSLGKWRDTQLRLDGPVVSQLQLSFAEDWYWAKGETIAANWSAPPNAEGADALVLSSGPSDRLETGSLYFCNAINAATDRLWIATAYFVPDVDILSALKLAALRGVDVRILVPDKRDHWLVWLAAFAYFDEIRRAGVKIYRYEDGFMHSKMLLVDDWMASVGTLNLDNRSCRLNFEQTAVVFDAPFVAELAELLETDMARAKLFNTNFRDIRSPAIRYGAPIARMFAPIL